MINYLRQCILQKTNKTVLLNRCLVIKTLIMIDNLVLPTTVVFCVIMSSILTEYFYLWSFFFFKQNKKGLDLFCKYCVVVKHKQSNTGLTSQLAKFDQT